MQAAFVAAVNHLNMQPPRTGPKTSTKGALAAINAEMVHDMNGYMGPFGTQRFLPWHRIYLLQLERACMGVPSRRSIRVSPSKDADHGDST